MVAGETETATNLEYYRKQAKKLLRDYRAGNREARKRVRTSGGHSKLALHDAQWVVAQEAGFSSWPALRSHILDQGRDSDASGAEVKQSYEGNPVVQRWIARYGTEDGFLPGFLTDHHERDWLLSSLAEFHANGLITDILGVVKPGKEATVYCCRMGPDSEFPLAAAKVYRPRMFRNLKNDARYRRNRHNRPDLRRDRAMHVKSQMGRDFGVSAWISYEWKTLRLLADAGADVPRPLAHHGNAILMEFIGNEDGAAPLLHHCRLPADAQEQALQTIMENVELFLRNDRIHGDLSAYNVLYWRDRPLIIDFAQAVEPDISGEGQELLRRDIDRIYRYFEGREAETKADQASTELWSRFVRRTL
jgi:RIO kinase 1